MAGGNVINDYFDVDIDRVNKRSRPLPQGRIGLRDALVFSIILFALGVFLSIFISYVSFVLALVISIALFFYGAKLKKTLFIGNISVSLFSALAFVYGGVAVSRWESTIIPGLLAFMFHLGREVIKDIEDQDADASAAANTLPLRMGTKAGLIVVTAVFTALILFTFIPYLFDFYSEAYLWLVLFGVDAVLLALLAIMWRYPNPATLRRISAVLKADMLVGLLAIYVGLPK